MRVLIADPNTLLRQGLACLFEGDARLDLVGEARTGREAVEMALELRPDVVLMELTVPELNGIDATRRIVDALPSVRVIGLSDRTDEASVVEMLEAGASGYVVKANGDEEIGQAIRAVTQGKTFVSPDVAHVLVTRGPGATSDVHRVFEELTQREREVLQLVSEGSTSKEIAARLKITVTTVDTHRHNVMRKVGAGTVADLVKLAIRAGLTTVEG